MSLFNHRFSSDVINQFVLDFIFMSMIVSDGQYMLVVLLFEIHRVSRHDVLHFKEEKQSRVNSARHPSRLYAVLCLDGTEIRTRYTDISRYN